MSAQNEAGIKTGVIGYPVAHSKSPIIHNHWIEKHGLKGSYEAIEIRPENLAARLDELIAAGYAGFNVTVPHKETVMELCAEISDEARDIGAVNTVVIKDGKLYGDNTDAFGFVQNIKEGAPAFKFANKCALVLGAGGAAKAVIYGLAREGVERIYIANRTKERATKLIEESAGVCADLLICAWEDRSKILGEIDLLVNTTSLGMKGQSALEIDLFGLKKGALVNDIVYVPLETDILKQAKAQGAKTVDGIGMLLHQARAGFEAWYGIMPAVTTELREKVLA